MTKQLQAFLTEALTPEQKKTVDDWSKKVPDSTKKLSSELFGGKEILIHPLNASVGNVPIHPLVKEHLEKHGYSIPSSADYHAGYSVSPENQIVSIGKALNRTKAEPHVVSSFVNDPNRSGSTQKDLAVAYTWHPHHVAGMQTDRGWTQCMDMDGGGNREHLKHDIEQGTHVAYLIHKDDTQIERPIARIALKPFSSIDGHVALVPEQKTYGTASTAFQDAVGQFADTHFPMRKNTHYRLHSDLYKDSSSDMSDYDDSAIKEHVKHAMNGTSAVSGSFIRNDLKNPKNIHTAIDHLLGMTASDSKSPENLVNDKTYVAKSLVGTFQNVPVSPEHVDKIVNAIADGTLHASRDLTHSLQASGHRMYPHTASKLIGLMIDHRHDLSQDGTSVINNNGVTGDHLLKAARAGIIQIHDLPVRKYTPESIADIHANILHENSDSLSASNALASKHMTMPIVHEMFDKFRMEPMSQYHTISAAKRLGGNSGPRNPNYKIEDARDLDQKIFNSDDNHHGLAMIHPDATPEDFEHHHDMSHGNISNGLLRAIKSHSVVDHMFESPKHQEAFLGTLYPHAINQQSRHVATMTAVAGQASGMANIHRMVKDANVYSIFSPGIAKTARRNIAMNVEYLANEPTDKYHEAIRSAVSRAVDHDDSTFAHTLIIKSGNKVKFPKAHVDYVREQSGHPFKDTPTLD